MSIIGKYRNLSIQVKASLWFLVASFLQKGISIITTPIFTRLLSTSEYGKYNVFNSWLTIATVFVTLNMYGGMYVRGLVKNEKERYSFSSSLQGLSLVLVAVWTLIYLVFRYQINKASSLTTVQVLAMLLMIWATSAYSFWAAEQRVELHYRSLVIITVIVSFFKPVVGIIFVINAEDKVTARILGLLLVELFVYTFCFVTQMRRGKQFFSAKYWKGALVFCIPLIPHYLSASILNGADKIMIEQMVGTAEAGIYSLAYSLSQVMKLFNVALAQTIEPWLYKQIKKGDLKSMSRVAYPSWIIIGVLNLILIAFAPEAVAIFAPKSYHNAIWMIPPVAISVYYVFLYSFFAVFEFYYGKTKYIAIATTVGAVLNIVLNYVFIKIFGYYAAGYTTLVCYMLYAIMHYVFMIKITKKEHGLSEVYNKKILLGLSTIITVFGLILLFTYKYPLIRYSIVVVCFSVIVCYRKRIKLLVKELVSIKKHSSD